MTHPNTPGDLRPDTSAAPARGSLPELVPLLALRRAERRVIPPSECRLGPECLVCRWRREGRLDLRSGGTPGVVREPDPWPCPSAYCPGCGSFACRCLAAEVEDALAEAAYRLGFADGLADGPESRPTRAWLARTGYTEAPSAYLDGYDHGCASLAWPGDTPQGDTPQGDTPQGDTPQGDTPQGDSPDGGLPEGGPVPSGLVTERAAGYAVPAREARAARVACEASRWLRHAERAALGDPAALAGEALTAKALASVAYAVAVGAQGYAVPTKLARVRPHGARLRELAASQPPDGRPLFAPLELALGADGQLDVWHGGEPLGRVLPKHAAWVRPLASRLRVYLTRVTGTEHPGRTPGANVVLAGIAAALDEATLQAVPSECSPAPSGDCVPTVFGPPALPAPRARLRLVSGPGPDPADVVLARTVSGRATASVPHVARHSPTGVEWGYRGAGPADLALSVLTALAGADAAEAHAAAFADEVVAWLPRPGGVLRAACVRRWLAAQAAPGAPSTQR